MKSFAYHLVACAVMAALVLAVVVGIIDSATKTGPGCPAPVPADWIGYCDDFDAR